MEFEWDVTKAQSNVAKHGVTFEAATHAFFDETARIVEDQRQNYGEDRFSLFGLIAGRLHVVVFTTTNSANTVRLISARRANKRERKKHGIG